MTSRGDGVMVVGAVVGAVVGVGWGGGGSDAAAAAGERERFTKCSIEARLCIDFL